MYLNSLGVNGAAGTQAAQAAFQAGPGYQWQVDQATDAAARKAASLGIAGSGNTLAEIGTRAQNLANTEYGNWQTNLAGFVPQEASVTGQAAAGQAGIYGQTAQNKANVAGNVASGTANSNTAAANAEMAGSGAFWNSLLNLGGSVAKAYSPGKTA